MESVTVSKDIWIKDNIGKVEEMLPDRCISTTGDNDWRQWIRVRERKGFFNGKTMAIIGPDEIFIKDRYRTDVELLNVAKQLKLKTIEIVDNFYDALSGMNIW